MRQERKTKASVLKEVLRSVLESALDNPHKRIRLRSQVGDEMLIVSMMYPAPGASGDAVTVNIECNDGYGWHTNCTLWLNQFGDRFGILSHAPSTMMDIMCLEDEDEPVELPIVKPLDPRSIFGYVR